MLEIRLEAASAALFEFYRQDHVTFWDNVSNGSSNPLPAILLTDTGTNWFKMYKNIIMCRTLSHFFP